VAGLRRNAEGVRKFQPRVASTPRVDAADIDEDVMPDYVTAYERFNAGYRDVFADRDTEDVLDEARG